jgi:histidinol-phosphate aminotransferase
VFLCSPNNPTGGVTPWAVIERLAAALIDRALVIVDEAYVEFADTASAATLLSSHPNLGVLRTLSKARALAGARIGALLADPRIITLLRRIMPPYPLAAPAVEAALAALDDAGEAAMRKRVATVAMERERLEAALAALAGVRAVLPSQANFLCVRFADAAGAYEGLLERGIVVRDVSRYTGLADCLRISIGTAADNDRVLAALAARAAA